MSTGSAGQSEIENWPTATITPPSSEVERRPSVRTTGERPDHRGTRAHARKGTEHPGAAALVVERSGKGRRATEQQRRGNTLHRARSEQPTVVRRQRAQHESPRRQQKSGAEHTPVTDDIAEPAEREHQACVGQHIRRDHPSDRLRLERKRGRNRGERDVDRDIEGRQRSAEPHDEEPG